MPKLTGLTLIVARLGQTCTHSGSVCEEGRSPLACCSAVGAGCDPGAGAAPGRKNGGDTVITSDSDTRQGMPGAKRSGPRRARRASIGPTASPAVRGLCAVAAAACAATLFSACASQRPAPGPTATINSKPAATAGPVRSASPPNPSGGAAANGAPPTTTSHESPEPHLTAIRVAERGGYDQVVFQFANGVPHYRIGYVAAVRQDAKGTPVPLPGRSFLRVVFHPSSEATTLPAGPAGPGTISPYFPALLQLSAAGDFEGYLSFGLGLSGRGGYRVYTLTQPGRVVIDLPHLTLPKFPGIWDITSWRQFWQFQTAYENGHQPWLGSPPMVVAAWAHSFSSRPAIRQTAPDTFQVTDPIRARTTIVSGTRPVTTGPAQLWVITSITYTPATRT